MQRTNNIVLYSQFKKLNKNGACGQTRTARVRGLFLRCCHIRSIRTAKQHQGVRRPLVDFHSRKIGDVTQPRVKEGISQKKTLYTALTLFVIINIEVVSM